MNSIIIIGGDKRQVYLKNIFANSGYICEHIDSSEKTDILGQLDFFDIIMLPLPVSKDKEHIYSENKSLSVKIKSVIGSLNPNQLLVAGSIDNALKAYLYEKKIPFFDYFEREDFVIYNAHLTAVGALRLLLDNTEEIPNSKKVLVTGYGRVSKAVAETLKNNGMDVYIAARNRTQLTDALCRGYKIINISQMSSCIYLFDYIFNTVPFKIFTMEDMLHFKGKYFELASKPFGVDKEFFSEKEDSYIDGGALPGKFLPCSSADMIAEITFEHIKQRKGGD